MATRKGGKAADAPKKPFEWSAEAFGEGGYEVVPPEKEEEFLKMAEEENRRRRPGMYADYDMATPRLSLLNPVNLVNPVYKPAPRNSRKRLRSAKPKPKW